MCISRGFNFVLGLDFKIMAKVVHVPNVSSHKIEVLETFESTIQITKNRLEFQIRINEACNCVSIQRKVSLIFLHSAHFVFCTHVARQLKHSKAITARVHHIKMSFRR